MPNLSEIKEIDGNLYCWDYDTERFVLVKLIPIYISEVPPKVISTFFKYTSDIIKNKKEISNGK